MEFTKDLTYIPTVVGRSAATSDPRSFILTTTISEKGGLATLQLNALIDTGAMVSSIRQSIVQELNFQIIPASPLFITYGNETEGVSRTTTLVECQIGEAKFNEFPCRLVKNQNIDLILGTDWMITWGIVPDPNTKELLKRQGTTVAVVASNQVQGGLDQQNIPTEVADFLALFPNLWSDSPVQTITNAPIEHHIDTGDALPIVRKGRRFSDKENQVIDAEVEKMLQLGVIRPSDSPWCAPPVVAPKPDGGTRFCNNFRGLNSVTKKDKYPLPNMNDLIDRLAGSSWYSIIDLKSAYWQIPIKESDKQKTAFVTRKGLWEYNVLPFGLCNSPATFARFMETILRGVSSHTLIYLDDCLCFGRTREENLQQVLEILRIFNHWNLKISIKKSKFLQREIEFLGFIVSNTGVKSNPKRVLPIQNWPIPTSIKELQQFLGICNFYHKFIENLASIAAPLYLLLRKDVTWAWSTAANSAFTLLKQKLIALPELAYPDPNVPYDLHCDSSDYTLGAVLVQNGRPIAYASRSLNAAERNYSTTERECLAVHWALQYLHCYVHGATLTVYTDHAALKALLATKEPKGRIARWIMDIWSYEFTLCHKPGNLNTDADALGRIVYPEYHINSNTTHTDFLRAYRDAQTNDPDIQRLLQQAHPAIRRGDNGLLFYTKQVPNVLIIPQRFRQDFIHSVHDTLTGGHLGRDKTLGKAQDNGWWPTMTQDISYYVQTCLACQKHKTPTHKYTELKSISVGGVGELLAADVAFLPTSTRGNKYLLVFMEYLTRWVEAFALDTFDANTICNVLIYSIVLKYSTPKKLLTDNGTNFIAEATKLVCQRLGIRKIETSVEHPSTDGLVERMNRTVKSTLGIYIEDKPQAWDDYLPFVVFAINTSRQASTGYSPFEAMYGQKPRLPSVKEVQLNTEIKTYTSRQWVSYLNHYLPVIHNNIKQNLQQSQARQQKYFNQGRKEKEQFFVGDSVWKTKMKENWKFSQAKFTGPWIIKKFTNKDQTAVELQIENKKNRGKQTTTANIRDIYRVKRRIESSS